MRIILFNYLLILIQINTGDIMNRQWYLIRKINNTAYDLSNGNWNSLFETNKPFNLLIKFNSQLDFKNKLEYFVFPNTFTGVELSLMSNDIFNWASDNLVELVDVLPENFIVVKSRLDAVKYKFL